VHFARLAIVTPFGCRRRKEQCRFGSAACCPQMPSLMNKAECHAYSVPQMPLSARKVSARIPCDKRKFFGACGRSEVGLGKYRGQCLPERSL